MNRKEMPPLFEKNVKDLDDAATALGAILKSQDGYRPSSIQESFGYLHAYQLFYALVAFLRHVQISKFNLKGDLPNIWDPSTLAAMSRNIWDTYASYRFYSHEPNTQEEFRFRQLAGNYIAEVRRIQMIRTMNPLSPAIPELEQTLFKAKAEVENNAFFQGLDEPTQKKLIRDKEISAIFIPHEILGRAGINKEYFQSTYKYLSNHSHFYSFAFSQALEFDIREYESQVVYQMMIEFTSIIICNFLEDLKKWFPGSEYLWSQELTQKVQYWKLFNFEENRRRH